MNKDALLKQQQHTIEAQSKLLEQLSFQVEKLTQQVEQLLRQLYGKKSEKGTPKKADDNQAKSASGAPKPCINNNKTKNTPKRSRLPDHIERQDVIHDIAEADKVCKACHSPLHRMGERVSERLDFIPAKLIVKRHICYKWGCRCGAGSVLTASLPNQAIEKGIPGTGLLAEIVVNKYQDALPLYRQMLRFKRLGYTISDSTMGDWVRECALLLKPIVKLMRKEMLLSKKIHTDDTPVPVLTKGKTRNARLWVYLADQSTPNAMCLYDYTPTRHASGPAQWLDGYHGYLQADAYNGYDGLYTDGHIIEVGCVAHMRRKFYDVAVAANGPSHAADIMQLIAQLYGVERHIKAKTSIERFYYRKKFAKPKLKKLKQKINQCYRKATINSPFHNALSYARNHWVALCRYLADGDLDIDNNKAERAIKPLVIGRKNWLFAGSHTGGERAAIMYSIIETCKMNDINPFVYLQDVLEKIPNTLQQDIRQLLPYQWKLLQPCSNHISM